MAGLSRRVRAWLMAAGAFALVLAYLVGWATYAYVHLSSSTRYEVVAGGAAAQTPDAAIELVSLTETPELADQKYGGESTLPPPGAIWVVAEVEVTTRPVERGAVCDLWLIGPDRRRWEQDSSITGRNLPSSCLDDSIKPGRAARVEAVYAVPTRFADQIIGLAVTDNSSAARAQLLRPA